MRPLDAGVFVSGNLVGEKQSVYNPLQGAVPKWLREQSAKLRCSGSTPLGASKPSLLVPGTRCSGRLLLFNCNGPPATGETIKWGRICNTSSGLTGGQGRRGESVLFRTKC